MSFIELPAYDSDIVYYVCIDHVDYVYTEKEITRVHLISNNELTVKGSAFAITRQIHFLKSDSWTEVKRQTVVDLIKQYGFEEGNRRYIEGAEEALEQGRHYGSDKPIKTAPV